MNTKLFWIFGPLQSLSLGAIIFLLFRGLRMTAGQEIIGMDTQCVLSVVFPLFLLLTEAAILYGRQKKNS
jgi:hypothetical protein